jgi:hypothetical protein
MKNNRLRKRLLFATSSGEKEGGVAYDAFYGFPRNTSMRDFGVSIVFKKKYASSTYK